MMAVSLRTRSSFPARPMWRRTAFPYWRRSAPACLATAPVRLWNGACPPGCGACGFLRWNISRTLLVQRPRNADSVVLRIAEAETSCVTVDGALQRARQVDYTKRSIEGHGCIAHSGWWVDRHRNCIASLDRNSLSPDRRRAVRAAIRCGCTSGDATAIDKQTARTLIELTITSTALHDGYFRNPLMSGNWGGGQPCWNRHYRSTPQSSLFESQRIKPRL